MRWHSEMLEVKVLSYEFCENTVQSITGGMIVWHNFKKYVFSLHPQFQAHSSWNSYNSLCKSCRGICLLNYFIYVLGGLDSKESVCNAGDLGSVPGLGNPPGGGHGNPLQYSCLKKFYGQRSLMAYSPWGHKELDTTEQLNTRKNKPKKALRSVLFT